MEGRKGIKKKLTNVIEDHRQNLYEIFIKGEKGETSFEGLAKHIENE